jgi:hypothetical protein
VTQKLKVGKLALLATAPSVHSIGIIMKLAAQVSIIFMGVEDQAVVSV